jgi:uncharacterized membrane protein YuzA (DUF378 family)
MKNLSSLEWIVIALVAIGGLNWGLVGLFQFDLVAAIFGDMSALSRVVYSLVGVAAIGLLALSPRFQSKT